MNWYWQCSRRYRGLDLYQEQRIRLKVDMPITQPIAYKFTAKLQDGPHCVYIYGEEAREITGVFMAQGAPPMPDFAEYEDERKRKIQKLDSKQSTSWVYATHPRAGFRLVEELA